MADSTPTAADNLASYNNVEARDRSLRDSDEATRLTRAAFDRQANPAGTKPYGGTMPTGSDVGGPSY